ncbi:MAG TPA: hypothetical protein VFI24_24920 [Pyrinomonadaceae bacterium]|jgi:hypothetical protein|nr:hypothetical protein [Pyrinomonadaceae bacterium]
MPARKKGERKKSKSQKSTSSPRLKKAVPPPDNPLLRHQADEILLEGENASQEKLAKLRVKALEQTQRMASSDSSGTVNTTQRADEG